MKQAFSLMEMMVVLLIVAIIAAATAPMVTKKMSRNAGTGDSPWVFTGLNNSIAYNMNGSDNSSVIIGTSRLPNGWNQRVRLYIDSGNNAAHIAFGSGNNEPFLLTADPANGRVGFSNQEIPNQSIAMGAGQEINDRATGIIALGQGASISWNASDSIVIGQEASASGNDSVSIGHNSQVGGLSIAMGYNAVAEGPSSIAIGTLNNVEDQDQNTYAGMWAMALGSNTHANDWNAIAIGNDAFAESHGTINHGAIAIGNNSEASYTCATAIGPADGDISTIATREHSTAIGSGAQSTHQNSTAIGYGAETTTTNQIVLGRPSDTVYIPGNLVVNGNVVLARNANSAIYMRARRGSDGGNNRFFELRHQNDGKLNSNTSRDTNVIPVSCDRRLKNVGEKYTAGLAELKKLDFFHYTFKKDEAKTPHVGVMAQDLEKVFPDAVTKGEDGYLRIRFEDMFYAVINAVKELDNKITEILENITQINSTDEKQNETIAEQQKTIELLQNDNAEQKKLVEEQQKLINELAKRIEKLEESK